MKFGQLIEYNMGNIFLEKSYTKCCGETIPIPFYKKSKLNISPYLSIFSPNLAKYGPENLRIRTLFK